MYVIRTGVYVFDFINDVYVFNYFIKYVVILIIMIFRMKIEESVVIYVNEELWVCWVRIYGMCYGNCIYFIV